MLQTHKVTLAKQPLARALRNLLTATHTRVSITVTISSADEQITNVEPMSSSFSYVRGSANKLASKRNGPKRQVSWRSGSWMLSRLQKEQITWLGPLAAETDCFSPTTSCPEGDNPICYWSVCPNWMYRPLVSVYCRSSLGDATLYPLASKKKKKRAEHKKIDTLANRLVTSSSAFEHLTASPGKSAAVEPETGVGVSSIPLCSSESAGL